MNHFWGSNVTKNDAMGGRWPKWKTIWSCDASRGPLLVRYYLIQTVAFALYLHHLKADDEDRALHDHPWSFLTFLFHRGYWEHVTGGDLAIGYEQRAGGWYVPRDEGRRFWRRRFSILWRPAEWKHRLELDRGRPTWTLVLRFRTRREWGFDVPGRGWIGWKAYGKEWCD